MSVGERRRQGEDELRKEVAEYPQVVLSAFAGRIVVCGSNQGGQGMRNVQQENNKRGAVGYSIDQQMMASVQA